MFISQDFTCMPPCCVGEKNRSSVRKAINGGRTAVANPALPVQRLSISGGVRMEPGQTKDETEVTMTAEEQAEEQKLIRRLQMMMNMVIQVIAQDSSLSIDEAAQMIGDSRKAALAMFPGKELAYDIIWRPRFQRLMRERFRIQ